MRGFAIRIMEAVKRDPNIVCDRDKLNAHVGSTQAYLETLGIRKADLLKLERHNMAIRGRLPERSGHRVRWIILRDPQ